MTSNYCCGYTCWYWCSGEYKKKNNADDGFMCIYLGVLFLCINIITIIISVAFFSVFLTLVVSNNLAPITWISLGIFIFFLSISVVMCCFLCCRSHKEKQINTTNKSNSTLKKENPV